LVVGDCASKGAHIRNNKAVKPIAKKRYIRFAERYLPAHAYLVPNQTNRFILAAVKNLMSNLIAENLVF